jgi:hypothetical protein
VTERGCRSALLNLWMLQVYYSYLHSHT